MEHGTLLDEALGSLHLSGRVVLLEDCVETSAAFILHHILKRSLSQPPHSSNVVVFVAFAHPFSHYDRILRRLGCNLVVQRDNDRFFFFDVLVDCPDGEEGKNSDGGLVALYGKIQKTISALPQENKNCITVMIDDISLMEVAAKGSTNLVLDFLHYCHTLVSEFVRHQWQLSVIFSSFHTTLLFLQLFISCTLSSVIHLVYLFLLQGCSLVMLNHDDIYSDTVRPSLILQMEYLADILIRAEPLATGLASDVHGQLTVLNSGKERSRNKLSNFQFKVKENSVEYFYPGSRT